MTDEPQAASEQRFGRTGWDFGTYLLWGIGALIVIALLILFEPLGFLSLIPLWAYAAVGMSFIFTPWLVSRAKDDARLLMVYAGAGELTEYRVGKKYRLRIEGHPVEFSSLTGTRRLLLTEFDKTTGDAQVGQFKDHTVFDLVRDLRLFDRMAADIVKLMLEDRDSKRTIAIEAEKRIGAVADQYLHLLYGTHDISELHTAVSAAVDDDDEVEEDASGPGDVEEVVEHDG